MLRELVNLLLTVRSKSGAGRSMRAAACLVWYSVLPEYWKPVPSFDNRPCCAGSGSRSLQPASISIALPQKLHLISGLHTAQQDTQQSTIRQFASKIISYIKWKWRDLWQCQCCPLSKHCIPRYFVSNAIYSKKLCVLRCFVEFCSPELNFFAHNTISSTLWRVLAVLLDRYRYKQC